MNFMVNVALVVAGAVLLIVGAAAEAAAILWLSIACALIAFMGIVVSSRFERHREALAVAGAGPGWARPEAPSAVTTPEPAPRPVEEEAAPTAEAPTVVERPAPAAAGRRRRRRAFPIEGYDAMRVRDILPLLEDLDAEDLEVVRRHELENKDRTTVVKRADALLAELRAARGVEEEEAVPIDGYDGMRVRDILPILDHLDPDDLELVRRYEADTKNRPTVIRRVDQLLAAAEAVEDVEEPAPEPEPVTEPQPVVEPEPAAVGGHPFPIEDYEQRRLGEILALVEDLDEADLRLVAEREHHGQRRAVIINKIDALSPGTAAAVRGRPQAPASRARPARRPSPPRPSRPSASRRRPGADEAAETTAPAAGPLPIEGYDAMPVREIVPRLDDLDVVQLEWVRRHEQDGKRRGTVLRRIEQLMAQRQGTEQAAEPEELDEEEPTARIDRATWTTRR